jgi:outer membrane protein OmpA-like peptidoglycan-associated protein
MQRFGWWVIVAMVGASGAARAQSGRLDLRMFRPAVDSKGFVTVNGSAVLGPGDVSFGLVTTWGRDVLLAGDGQSGIAVHNQLSPTLQAAVGLGRGLELALALPVGITGGTRQTVGEGATDFGAQALGDLGLAAKLRLLSDWRHGVGLGLVAQVFLPTGDAERLLGEDQVVFEPSVVVDRQLGRVALAATVGGRIRPSDRGYDPGGAGAMGERGRVVATSELRWGGAASFAIVPQRVALTGEIYGAVGSGQRDAPAEALGGIRLYLAQRSYFELGGGAALTGDSSYAAAAGGRLYVGFIYEPAVGDRDGDGIPDDVDRCPDDPEDRDGFQDEDGCPDPDNDGDGIIDLDDRCPNEPETKNGFQDEDGCPDTFEPDRDGDGIVDRLDQCPDEPEDRDGFQDEDGCPDPDNDGDGIIDLDDLCPNEPETKNGFQDEDGCPDRRAEVRGGMIQVQPIYFETDKDIIKPISFPVLDDVAGLMRDNPQLTHVEIQGHADERSSDAHNMDLTERRARSVLRYLLGQGIEPDRLTSKGFGETRPLCREHTEACWSRNRRVDFIIMNATGVAASSTPH